jgi:hypothetical protein
VHVLSNFPRGHHPSAARSPPGAIVSAAPPPFSGQMAPRGDGGQSTYGFPIYCAGWLPLAHILKPDAPAADASSSAPPPQMVVLGGGGGVGRNGVPNKIVVAALEPAPALSTEAVSARASEIPRGRERGGAVSPF